MCLCLRWSSPSNDIHQLVGFIRRKCRQSKAPDKGSFLESLKTNSDFPLLALGNDEDVVLVAGIANSGSDDM